MIAVHFVVSDTQDLVATLDDGRDMTAFGIGSVSIARCMVASPYGL